MQANAPPSGWLSRAFGNAARKGLFGDLQGSAVGLGDILVELGCACAVTGEEKGDQPVDAHRGGVGQEVGAELGVVLALERALLGKLFVLAGLDKTEAVGGAEEKRGWCAGSGGCEYFSQRRGSRGSVPDTTSGEAFAFSYWGLSGFANLGGNASANGATRWAALRSVARSPLVRKNTASLAPGGALPAS